jgi:hypothetical protein
MSLPGVSIQIKDGALGRTTATDDGVAALVVTGIAATSLALNTAKVIYSLQEAIALGITLATHPHAYTQISEFFDETGGGAELWIMLISEATTHAAVYTALTGPMAILLNAAGGRVTIAGHSMGRAGGYSPTMTGLVDYDLPAVAALAQTLANAQATKFAYVRIMLDGSYLLNPLTGVVSIKGVGSNVAVFCGATETGKRTSSMGRFLGRLAAYPLHYSAARVKTGIFAANGFLTSGLALSSYSDGQITSLHDAGYIVLRTFAGRYGAYISDDVNLAAADSDFSSISRGRLMDKACRLAYDAYVNELNDVVELDPATGKLLPTKVTYLEDVMNRRLQQRMLAEGNCSDAKTYVDADQNVLSTDTISVTVSILPHGTIKYINVQLGFVNPLTA